MRFSIVALLTAAFSATDADKLSPMAFVFAGQVDGAKQIPWPPSQTTVFRTVVSQISWSLTQPTLRPVLGKEDLALLKRFCDWTKLFLRR